MRLSKARTGPFVLKLGFVFLYLSFGKLAFSAGVTLAWNPNSESNLAGYRIQYGTAPGIHPATLDAGNQTTYTVSGLGPGTYYFVVLAYDASGLQSPPSNEVSVTITATPPPPPTNASLTASPGSVGPGGNVTVTWSAIGNVSVRDWIGHYPAAANDGGYTTWKYTSSCGQSPGGVALPSGSCIFAMPAVPGIYQFRLFANETYTRLAASGMVTVGGAGSLTASPSAVAPGGIVTVSWNNVSGAAVKDWLGRYAGGSGDLNHGDWKHTSSCTQSPGGSANPSGSCTFTMPLSPGIYEFRLFAGESYTRLAGSAPVMVGAP
jgi:Fibronectin type III domain